MRKAQGSRLVGLTPALYDHLEAIGSREIPPGFFTAFRPATYERGGFPTRVHDERELIRHIDHNFEPETAALYHPAATNPNCCYVNAFTGDEQNLIRAVQGHVAALSRRTFGRAIRPMTNLLVQVAPFRILCALSKLYQRPSLRVFEAGPGLGYLGALLALAGHGHASFDVTQSLYLWQHLLLSEIAGNDFQEEAFMAGTVDLHARRVVHLPWWRYTDVVLAPSSGFDLVYSNSNLCEMTPLALKLLLDTAPRLLAGSPVGLFVFMHGGDEGQVLWRDVRGEFDRRGYRKIRGLPFHAFALDDRDPAPLLKAFAEGAPFYNPSRSSERFNAEQAVGIHRDEAPVDVEFTTRYHGWKPPFLD